MYRDGDLTQFYLLPVIDKSDRSPALLFLLDGPDVPAFWPGFLDGYVEEISRLRAEVCLAVDHFVYVICMPRLLRALSMQTTDTNLIWQRR